MSPKQIAASRANGRHSRGPVTERGLQNCASSSVRHGFYIQSFEESMTTLGENRDEFNRLEQDLIAYWRPAGAFRESLVRRLARALWKLERGDSAESGQTVRQLETLQAACDSEAGQIDARFYPLLADLEFLLDSVCQRDFSDGDQLMFAFNRIRRHRNTARLERIHELLLEEEDTDDVELDDDDDLSEAASQPGQEALPEDGDAGEPDQTTQAAAEAAAEESAAEAESLLREELQAVRAEVELLKQRDAEASPAARSARLAPGSPLLIRWQDSLGRQAERMIKLLCELEARDELFGMVQNPTRGSAESAVQVEAEK